MGFYSPQAGGNTLDPEATGGQMYSPANRAPAQ